MSYTINHFLNTRILLSSLFKHTHLFHSSSLCNHLYNHWCRYFSFQCLFVWNSLEYTPSMSNISSRFNIFSKDFLWWVLLLYDLDLLVLVISHINCLIWSWSVLLLVNISPHLLLLYLSCSQKTMLTTAWLLKVETRWIKTLYLYTFQLTYFTVVACVSCTTSALVAAVVFSTMSSIHTGVLITDIQI